MKKEFLRLFSSITTFFIDSVNWLGKLKNEQQQCLNLAPCCNEFVEMSRLFDVDDDDDDCDDFFDDDDD